MHNLRRILSNTTLRALIDCTPDCTVGHIRRTRMILAREYKGRSLADRKDVYREAVWLGYPGLLSSERREA
jgi:hypothetical protein